MRRLLPFILLALTAAGPRQRLLMDPIASCDQRITELAPTLWLDGSNPKWLTVTATSTVSTWADKSGNARDFTQGTAANQPAVTLASNRENKFANSADFSNATYWTPSGTTVSAQSITASAGNVVHKVTASASNYTPFVAGGIYILEADIAYDNYQYAAVGIVTDSHWHSAVVDLDNGTITACENAASTTCSIATIGTKRYRVTITSTIQLTNGGANYITLAAGSASYRNDTAWNAAGTEKITVNTIQVRSSLADSSYEPTTTYAKYRGINGRSAVRFDGTNDAMTSAATLANVFNAGDKTFFVVTRPLDLTANRDVMRPSVNKWNLQIAAATQKWQLINNDGTNDTWTPTAAVNVPNVVMWHHAGGVGDAYMNQLRAPEGLQASGNTADLSGTLNLGSAGGANFWLGDIAELLTFNKVLPAADRDFIRRCLCNKWGANCQ